MSQELYMENGNVLAGNLSRGIIHLVGEITDASALSVMAQMMELDGRVFRDPAWPKDREKRIRLYINSPGGSVNAGLAIYDTMKCMEYPVDTVCVGMAASMAAVILAGGTRRYILPHAEVMIHQPSGGAAGMASDILIAADHIRERKQVLNEILSGCTGRTVEELQRDTERDRWMDPEEALRYGIVDEVIAYGKENNSRRD